MPVIPLTAVLAAMVAGLLQAWRTAVQQRLRAQLTVSGAGLVRYAYGAPVAVVLACAWLGLQNEGVPALGPQFFAYAAAGGLAQILGTNALIDAFGHRGFVAGTAFSKTEALQAALFSFIVLGERLPWLVWLGIAAGVCGIMLLGLGRGGTGLRSLGAQLAERGALLGLTAGGLFALTGVLVKLATQQLAMTDKAGAALVTLVVVMLLQTAMHGTWVALREPATWGAAIRTWRTSAQVGLLAALGSAFWFTGFALAPVALVRLIGQVEVVFTLGFGHLYLRERIGWREAGGLLLVSLGMTLALAAALG